MDNQVMPKILFAIAVLAVISGIYLITQQDYISGVSGAMVGLLLIYLGRIDKSKEIEE